MKSAQYKGNREVAVGTSEAIQPGPGEARLEVAFCGICGTDIHIFHGSMDQRVSKPQIIGHEASATVAEIGEGVTSVAVGDRVAVRPLCFGEPSNFDNGHAHVGKNLKFIGIDMPGGMQSSWTVPAYTLHALPESLSLQHGAMIEPAAVACHDVRLGEVVEGETCVVIGGGPIGLLIGLVAMQKGAKVILSEVNPSRLDLAKTLGFEVVDPTKQNLPEAVSKLTDGQMADCVFEVSGSAPGVEVMTELPNVRGRIVMVAIHPQPKPVNLFKFFWSEIKMIGARLYEQEDFDEAIQLASSGKLHLDKLITQVNPIDQVQETFEAIDANPDGIKYLIQCS
ncbi:2-desacetyl-2-hydroxyethyl bacteriochlorophyllide A dehydrogenase [Neorhodopirellula lusitana]|uniref:2-desacetyl-2-hydroxyethyl bacteriochlorophyllide A dehydrogenase n=1 Tax=Neorhodopirellula lusitana TaxID=445327 RepID=A0ABY1QD37_9BACT|nr:zinc-binding dehydrogenase [Neorhodopirellula lusitana]SMP63667.1 2-desacetyl-2-hydroxyethyl bacteriochlorophyllide A dehydrogenase [Neorhodopirellula lusitana]